jgi:predicted Zn-dependent peptidase
VYEAQPELTAPADTTVIGLEAENLWLGWKFEKASSLQADTMEVIQQMLSNGTAGLLDLDINQQMKMLGAWGAAVPMQDYSMLILGGTPKDGQTLEEVRSLLLAEIEKLKAGDYSDDLLPSVVNNLKLAYYNALESNKARARMYVNAFVNGTPWEQEVKSLDRVAGITKEQITAFVNQHFGENYVTVFKKQGVDPTIKKIDKPAITPIPTNRDYVSQFVTDIQNTEVKPIEPSFVKFTRDLTFANISENLPYIYVKNRENGRFQLAFRYEFGNEADLRYNYAAQYLDYLGTDSLSSEQIKQQFYKLACNYNIQVGDRNLTVSLNGLSENMPQAVALLEHLMQHAKADDEAYAMFVSLEAKSRMDAKADQRSNFEMLANYGIYGPYNPRRHDIDIKTLSNTDPRELLNLLKDLTQYKHTVLYYGPMIESELAEALSSYASQPNVSTKDVPENKHYVMQPTQSNEILLAPYDAQNIYMRMYHNEGIAWNPEEAPIQALFNEFFGGGMNSVVFQELREARGLAYNAFAYYMQPSHQDYQDMFFTHIITQNDKMADCIAEFHHILDSVPQSEGALNIAKESIVKRLASMRTTKFALINAWLVAQENGIDYDINERIYEAVPNLTMDDVVTFANERIARKPYRYVILGNEQALDMAALQQYGPVKRLTTEEIFGY